MAALSTNKEFYYGQSSIPQMAGVAGYIISILDAFLVNGFNSKNVSSISVTSNIATVTTSTAHDYEIGNIIVFSGSNESIFNDEFEIISIPSTTTFTFSITTALTSATGTITCKVAPLGWEKTYSGTNKAVYRSLDVTTNQLYLRVDDTQTLYATVTMYETMSNVDTGTGGTTVYWKKSTTANTTSMPWYAIGNKKTFYLFSDWHASYTLQPSGYCFGWFPSFKSGDGYNTMLIGHDVSTPTNPASYNDFARIGLSGGTKGQVIARSYSQLGSSILFYKYGGLSSHEYMGYIGLYNFPNPVDNGVHLFPVYIYESGNNNLRGKFPGVYIPNEHTNGSFLSRDKTVIVDGKRYIAYRITNSNAVGQYGNCWFALDEEWS